MDNIEAAKQVIGKLSSQGHIALFAGGYVRDLLMGHPSDDIDIATTASVEFIQQLFPKTIAVGIQFGIVIVVHEGHQFEVATFRKEGGYKDGRRPTEILPANPMEDAQRRDFTINGLFYNPLTEEVFDYVKGREDIEGRIIRAIGNPYERFAEDRLRMIRAVRYAIRFQFTIEEKTKKAILAHANDLFPAVAIERVWQELEKMARFSAFDHSLLALHEMTLLGVIFPELQNIPYSTLQERLLPLSLFPADAPLITKLLELFPDYTLDQKLLLCEYLKRSTKERDLICFYHHLTTAIHKKTPLELADWAFIYASPFFKTAFSLVLTHLAQEEKDRVIPEHEERSTELNEWIKRIENRDPLVKAADLVSRGVAPGPQMGLLLKQAERLAINERILDADQILNRLFST